MAVTRLGKYSGSEVRSANSDGGVTAKVYGDPEREVLCPLVYRGGV